MSPTDIPVDTTTAVIVAAKRTAIGTFGGALSKTPATDLGTVAVKAALEAAAVSADSVDEVIMGQVLQAGCGQNPARQVAINAGVPITTPSLTLNKLCGSGMKAVHLAAQAIMLGNAEVIVAGGQENMSLAPHLLPASRTGQRMGSWALEDSMLKDGLTCALSNGIHMGITAENLANQYDLSREAQDAYAVASQNKAYAAQTSGRFANEITPVAIPQRRGDPVIFDSDEFIKSDATEAGFAKARPAFDKAGTVTANNASGLNDGAAALVVMSAAKAKDLGIAPLARIVACASAGVEPTIMGIGPVDATKRCLAKAGWSLEDVDIIEANEAFAAQSLAVGKALGWQADKVNLNGGAIALGHPIGASGARILVTLIHEMIKQDAQRGLATMCIGGGQGIATLIERV